MRELEAHELQEVSGGLINFSTGAAGAILGGLGNGVSYLVAAEHPTAAGFAGEVVVGAASGFLIGSGGELFVLAYRGVQGAATLGTVATGVGVTIQATAGAVAREDKGGSE